MPSLEASDSDGGSPWFGVSLILVGAISFGLAFRIQELGFADENDPGARAFPMLLSICLMLGGALDAGQAWWRARHRPSSTKNSISLSADVILVVVLLIVYLIAVPWFGFFVSSFWFTALVARRMGAHWIGAFLASVTILVIAQFVFSYILRVQLPAGRLMEWFR